MPDKTPTPAAMRAALSLSPSLRTGLQHRSTRDSAIRHVETFAAIIDHETGLPEMLVALLSAEDVLRRIGEKGRLEPGLDYAKFARGLRHTINRLQGGEQ